MRGGAGEKTGDMISAKKKILADERMSDEPHRRIRRELH
jgi:hypothetical protein